MVKERIIAEVRKNWVDNRKIKIRCTKNTIKPKVKAVKYFMVNKRVSAGFHDLQDILTDPSFLLAWLKTYKTEWCFRQSLLE